jgi:hypothetical protein
MILFEFRQSDDRIIHVPLCACLEVDLERIELRERRLGHIDGGGEVLYNNEQDAAAFELVVYKWGWPQRWENAGAARGSCEFRDASAKAMKLCCAKGSEEWWRWLTMMHHLSQWESYVRMRNTAG